MTDEVKLNPVTDAEAFLNLIETGDGDIVHPVIYENANGKKHQFLIKEFTQEEVLEIATGALTFIDNKYVKQAKHEAQMSINLRIYYGVVKNVGTEDAPQYRRLFTLEQINGMYKTVSKGRLLNFLLSAVNLYNGDGSTEKKNN